MSSAYLGWVSTTQSESRQASFSRLKMLLLESAQAALFLSQAHMDTRSDISTTHSLLS